VGWAGTWEARRRSPNLSKTNLNANGRDYPYSEIQSNRFSDTRRTCFEIKVSIVNYTEQSLKNPLFWPGSGIFETPNPLFSKELSHMASPWIGPESFTFGTITLVVSSVAP